MFKQTDIGNHWFQATEVELVLVSNQITDIGNQWLQATEEELVLLCNHTVELVLPSNETVTTGISKQKHKKNSCNFKEPYSKNSYQQATKLLTLVQKLQFATYQAEEADTFMQPNNRN